MASAATPSATACGANATPSISIDVPSEVANGPLPVEVYAYQNDDLNGDNGAIGFNYHALYRGHMTTYYRYTPGYRVYQSTDGFVNYCINDEHQTYSANLILYCNHPAKTVAYVTLS